MIKKEYIILALYIDKDISYSEKENIASAAFNYFNQNEKYKIDVFIIPSKKNDIKCVFTSVNLTPEIKNNFKRFIKIIQKYESDIDDIIMLRKLKLLNMKIE